MFASAVAALPAMDRAKATRVALQAARRRLDHGTCSFADLLVDSLNAFEEGMGIGTEAQLNDLQDCFRHHFVDIFRSLDKCPKQHTLKLEFASIVYECDACNTDIGRFLPYGLCRRCDYSLCEGCIRLQAK